MDDATQTAKKRPSRLTIPLAKQHVVAAMLSERIPHRSIHEATGVSTVTIQKIKRQELAHSEQAEKVKKGLRNRFAIVADRALNRLSDEKLDDASAKDLIYIAAKATEIAEPAQPSVVETYMTSMQRFLVQAEPVPSPAVSLRERVERSESPEAGGVGLPQGGLSPSALASPDSLEDSRPV